MHFGPGRYLKSCSQFCLFCPGISLFCPNPRVVHGALRSRSVSENVFGIFVFSFVL